jgi:hypothetical protein
MGGVKIGWCCAKEDVNKVNPKRSTTNIRYSDNEEHIFETKIKATKIILQDIIKSEEEENMDGGCRN